MQPTPTLPSLRRYRSLTAAAIGFAGVLACGSPGPAPARPGTPPAPEVTPPRATGRWTLRRQAVPARYEIHSSAVIELTGDSLPGDSLSTFMVVSLSLADSADLLSMTGTIDSLRVARGVRITTPDSAPLLPISLRGVLDRQGGVIRLGDSTVVPDSLCTSTLDPLITTARDLFVRLPERLTSGAAWQDTTRTTSCRGRIPITTTTVAAYSVLGEQATGGRNLMAVSRSTTITLAGGGEQYGRSATVQGGGTGTATLLFDPGTAALVHGQSQSTVTVTFEAGMLRQAFTQFGRQEIRQR